MHDGVETQGIVEALAEHDFQGMRLNGMIRASGCQNLVFCAYCHPFKKHYSFYLRILPCQFLFYPC